MDRRSFVKTVSISSFMVTLSPLLAGSLPHVLVKQQRSPKSLATTIMAEFGPGFKVFEYRKIDGMHHATIGHLGNEYRVCSADLRAWTILSYDVPEAGAGSNRKRLV
ncbi:MAG: hypothetical protein WD397_00690 [Wenzhouxiangellaceae bacterium]